MSKRPIRGGVSLTRILVPLVSLGVLFLCWRLDLKWVTAPVILFLIVYYFVLPKLVRARLERFHRETLKLLTTNRAADVPRLARRNVFLQLFGPRGPLDAKLGLAYAATGEFAKALPCFESAIPGASDEEKPALQAGLCKAFFVCGEFGRAEAEGKKLINQGTRLPELLAAVARSRLGLGRNDDDTRQLLEDAERLSPSADVRLMIDLTRIEMAMDSGRKPREIPADADSSQPYLRGWIHLVRGRIREQRGDSEGAGESYIKAIKTAPGTFVMIAAQGFLNEVSPGVDTSFPVPKPSLGGHDPAVRRKKKKRK